MDINKVIREAAVEVEAKAAVEDEVRISRTLAKVACITVAGLGFVLVSPTVGFGLAVFLLALL